MACDGYLLSCMLTFNDGPPVAPLFPPTWFQTDKKARYGRPIGDVKSYADQGVTTTVTTIALDSGPERWAGGD